MTAPSSPVLDVIIVGGGFAGIGMAIQLRKQGITNFRLLDEGRELGGTWRDNIYPGAACDVESHLYSFSFAPNPNWSRTFSPQDEILAYIKACAETFHLQPHLELQTQVKEAHWDDQEASWSVTTDKDQTLRARVLINATGGLSRPALPDIPGLSDFEGELFHSARWNKNAKMEGKRVGIIGTGASAVQIIPQIAQAAEQLFVFQRTPHWLLPKRDAAISGFEKTFLNRFPAFTRLIRLGQYLLHESLILGFVRYPGLMKIGEWQSKRNLNRTVNDPELRAKLTPDFRMGCKRILLSNDYYPALQKENVSLITDPLARVTAKGIQLRSGKIIDLDVLVLATGFQAAEAKAPYTIRGRGGLDLNTAWKAGPEAYRGTTLHGFPNLFTLVGPNTGLGHSSMLLMIESQIKYISKALRHLFLRPKRSIEVSATAQKNYQAALQKRFPKTVWQTGCVSWYQMSNGRNTTLWPGTTFGFRWMMRNWDAKNYIISETSR